MARGQGSLRRTARIGAFLAAVMLALSLPSIAFAANTATFSGATPKAGSTTTVSMPKISVTVYDKYGVYGSTNYSMTVNRNPVARVLTRLSGWGRTKFKLAFTPTSALQLGRCTVAVSVRDQRGKRSTFTWFFTVADGIAPVTTTDAGPGYGAAATIHLFPNDVGGSGVAHTYYELDGSLTPVTYAGGITVPWPPSSLNVVHWLEFWSVDAAGNVEAHHTISFEVTASLADMHVTPALACTASGCHDTNLMVIHLGRCDRCHTGAALTNNCITCHGDNPHNHNPHLAITSTSDPSCTSCHGTNVATNHPSCATCHDNPDVASVIAAGGAHCETCHTTGYAAIHTTAAHAVPGSNTCSTGVCHASANAVTIHAPGAGCNDCHNPTDPATRNKVTSMATCGLTPTCHGSDINAIHDTVLPASHETTNSCAVGLAAPCHMTNVATIHETQLTGGPTPPGCAACHSVTVPAPSTNCQTVGCHPTDPHLGMAVHTDTTHDAACFNALCHGTRDVIAIHTNGDNPPGCIACHGTGVDAAARDSLQCENLSCHPNFNTVHNFVHVNASGETTTSSACTACHGTDLPTAHNGVFTGQPNLGCFCHTNVGIPFNMAGEMAPLLSAGTAECIDCHKDAHAAHGFAAPAASGHNTKTYGTIGAWTKFDGTGGSPLLTWTATQSFTVTSTKSPAAMAPGFGPGTVISAGQTGTVQTTWTFPTQSVFWPADSSQAPTTAVKGLTKDSVITCEDCHTGLSAAGPHGAAQNWGIDPNYPGDYSMAALTKKVGGSAPATAPATLNGTSGYSYSGIFEAADATSGSSTLSRFQYQAGWNDATSGSHAVICAKCHKLETALRPYDPSVGETSRTPGTSGTTNTVVVVGANTAHNSHHYDTKDGTDQCVSCHVAIPHGWTAPRLLVDVAKYEGTPYVSPNALEDMLTLAALNNHPIVPSSGLLPYVHSAGTVSSETTPTYDITRVGTVLWDESQCDACGDHFGNDVNHGGTGKNSTAVPVRIDEP